MLIEEQVSREISILSERIKNLFESHQLHDNSLTKKKFQFDRIIRVECAQVSIHRCEQKWPKSDQVNFRSLHICEIWSLVTETFFLRVKYNQAHQVSRNLSFFCSTSRSRVTLAPRWTLSIRVLETRIFYAFRVRNGSIFLYGGWFSTIECSFQWIRAQWLSLLSLNPASELFGKSSVAPFEAYSANSTKGVSGFHEPLNTLKDLDRWDRPTFWMGTNFDPFVPTSSRFLFVPTKLNADRLAVKWQRIWPPPPPTTTDSGSKSFTWP